MFKGDSREYDEENHATPCESVILTPLTETDSYQGHCRSVTDQGQLPPIGSYFNMLTDDTVDDAYESNQAVLYFDSCKSCLLWSSLIYQIDQTDIPLGVIPNEDYASSSSYYPAVTVTCPSGTVSHVNGPIIDFQVQIQNQTNSQNRKTRKSKEKRTALINNGNDYDVIEYDSLLIYSI